MASVVFENLGGEEAVNGILIDVYGLLPSYTVITRWLVDGEVVTHIVEHQVLDNDFTAVSDDMTLWYGHYGTPWNSRFPDSYSEAPMTRAPCMDVMTDRLGGLSRPDDVCDLSDDRQRVLRRHEVFKLHTLEQERVFDQRVSVHLHTPAFSDVFKARPIAND